MTIKDTLALLTAKLKALDFPRKGRIRLLALLVILVTLGLLCTRRCRESGQETPASLAPAKSRHEAVPKAVGEFLAAKSFDTTLLSTAMVPDGSDTLIVKLTTDDLLQRRLYKLLERYHPRCGAALVIRPKTGEVLAAVSYRNKEETLYLPDISNMLFWNEFPAASVFKIVTAAGAMECGLLNPDDEIGVSGNYYTLYKSQLKDNAPRWTRHLSIREAFAKSVNPLFGKIGQKILGMERLNKTAERFLFNQPIRFDMPVLNSKYVPPKDDYETAAMACGFNRTTTMSPIHAALIGGAIARDGTVPGLYLVETVEELHGSTRYVHTNDTLYSLASRETAALTRNIMMEVVRKGTARKGFAQLRLSRGYENLRMGGKTGSMDGLNPRGRCDWFVGWAQDPSAPEEGIAMAVVTVHGAFWTVHSSFIAAEAVRCYFDKNRKKPNS